MASRDKVFRIAVRKFGPFESAIARQWQAFEASHATGLELDAIALDLHPLHESLFDKRGLIEGDCDVALVNTDWLAEAAESEALADLSGCLKASPPEGYPSAWSDSLLRQQRFEARTLGVPYHDGPECLIYRRDLFDDPDERRRYAAEYGDALEIPRTWDEFHRVARFFTRPESGLYGTTFAAFPDGHNTVYDFCLQLWTRGGELFDGTGRMVLHTRQAQESLEYYRMLLNDRESIHPASRKFDSVQSGMAFGAGEIAMMVNWFGFAFLAHTSPESKVAGRVGIASVPAGPGGSSASLNVYWLLGIAAGSPHAEIAWRFVRHCAGQEMDKLTTLEGAIGCRKSTWSDPEVNALAPFYRELEHLHEGARELPRRREWSRLADIIDRMVLDAIDTDDPAAAILERAQARADERASRPDHERPQPKRD